MWLRFWVAVRPLRGLPRGRLPPSQKPRSQRDHATIPRSPAFPVLNQNEALFKLEKQSHEHREEILGFESFKTSHQGVVDELAQAKARIEELEEREGEDGGNKSGALLAAKMAEGMASVNNFSVSFYFFNSFLFYFLIFLVLTPRFFFFNNAGPNCHERKRDESHAGEVWLHGCDQGDRGP